MRFRFVKNDGGRLDAGFKGTTGDCVTRAISIATGYDYRIVYDNLNEYAKAERRVRGPKSAARTGVRRKVYEALLYDFGWKWFPTMRVGQGCKVHLLPEELPTGMLIVAVSKHLVAIENRPPRCIVYDLTDPQRGGTRCVYGYYQRERVRFDSMEEIPLDRHSTQDTAGQDPRDVVVWSTEPCYQAVGRRV